MPKENIKRIESADLRECWEKEDKDFTIWLSENLDYIDQLLNTELQLKKVEQPIGALRADIYCTDSDASDTQKNVLIENQLEKSDHKHLGQLLTYAAGAEFKPHMVIWISSEFRSEHRAAIDWLNEHGDKLCQFFGIKIELWKILPTASSSPIYCPRFTIECQPVGAKETESWQSEYWDSFKKFLLILNLNKDNSVSLRPVTNSPGHCLTFSFAGSGFQLNSTVHAGKNRLGVEIIVLDSKKNFEELNNQKEVIEKELGEKLYWQENPNKKVSRIVLYKNFPDIKKKESWSEQYQWLFAQLRKFYDVFNPRIVSMKTNSEA